jgi:PAS domain S-box-containing protein
VFRTCPESISFSLWEDGTYLDVNDAYERLYGYTRAEVIGRSAVALGLWVDPAQRKALLARLEREGRVMGFAARFRRKNGEVWMGELSAEASVLNGQRSLVVVLRDVTAQKAAEEALRKSEEKFSKVFRTCPEAIAIATLDDGIYLDVNDAFERLYGVPRAEAIGRSALALGVWVDPERRKELVRQLREHRRVTGFSSAIYRRAGGIRIAEIAAEAINIDGRDCLISVARDVTDQQRAEQQIRSLNAELEERVRQRTAELLVANRELESFSYSVSHDLRAPLRSIHGFSEALVEDCGALLSEQGKHFLGRIQHASQRMGQLIDDLLKLSHVTRAEMAHRPVNLTELATNVVRELQSAEPSRQVEVHIEEGLVAHGDARLLRVLLDNLLGNAWKFTSKTTVPRIEFTRKGGSSEVFQVRDNGAGFDMSYAQNLFGAFQRMHAATEFPGTGIGLATVQRIVHRHGGRIWAESAVSEGACFLFTVSGENRT